MVKALRSCLEAAKGKIKAGHLILRKSPKRTATGSSTASNISRIPIRHAGSTACYSGNIGILDEPGDCQLLAKSLFEGARLCGGATAGLDSFCARRRRKSAVGAEESLRRGRTKERPKARK